MLEFEATPANAGRIAAQTAKQVVLQRLREAEREVVYEEYAGKEGDIVSGVVQRLEGRNVIVDLGKTEAVLPPPEQARTEHYRSGQRLKVLLLEVFKAAKGPQVVVSRTHKDLLKRLFELEVPEIFKGIVEIKSIAREAGYRSKVAVYSRQEGVDPVGACVGMRGIRIQNVVNELNGERIDVVVVGSGAVALRRERAQPGAGRERHRTVTTRTRPRSSCRTGSSRWPSARRDRTPGSRPSSRAGASTSRARPRTRRSWQRRASRLRRRPRQRAKRR